LAEWPQRALGWLVDWGIGAAGFVVLFIVALILGAISNALFVLVYLVAALASLAWIVFVSVQVGQTGQSPGMRLIGLKCISKTTGQPIGAGMGVVRWIAHIVDSLICYIGWLFPLWDAEKQTIADKLLGTVVITVPKQNFSIQPEGGMSL
jgi:uncharacterized RDD family membrane protein YckC